MHFRFHPYFLLLMGSAVTTLAVIVFALARRRGARGLRWFVANMAVLTLWAACNALELAGVDLPTKIFWANLQYVFYGFFPLTLLASALQLTGYDRWARPRRLWWLAIVPVADILLVWFDPQWGLMRRNMHLDASGPFSVIAKDYGPFFLVGGVYANALLLVDCALLLRGALVGNRLNRVQCLTVFAGVSVTYLPNVLFVLGLSPLKFDITPAFLGPAGLLLAWGMLRYQLLDLMPLARAAVLETMDVGLLVIDTAGRAIDSNPAFRRFLGVSAADMLQDASTLFSSIPALAEAMRRGEGEVEFSGGEGADSSRYQARVSPLLDGCRLLGRLVVVSDVTARFRARQVLERQRLELAVSRERESLAQNLHDDLGQVLGFVHLQAQGVLHELSAAGVTIGQQPLARLADAAREAHEQIRATIREMRESPSDIRDLCAALRAEGERFSAHTGLPLQMNLDQKLVPPPPEVRMQFLYVAREALHNVAAHAGPCAVRLSLVAQGDALSLMVEDTGQGFAPEQKMGGYGQTIMAERAGRIGARLAVESAPGRGCRVRLTWREGEENDATAAG